MASLPPIVLSFAASDPTGGAGLQADLLTLASMGCHPLSVVTALTVQDTRGVEGLLAIDSEWVSAQARTLLEDMPVAAFKLGVLGTAENAAVIAEILADYPAVPVILDPVLASGRGDALADDALVHALQTLIVPQSTILTPNSIEARRLAEDELEDEALDLDECAERLLAMGCSYVLITGTHEIGTEVVNTLYADAGVVRTDRWPRLAGSYHGSGCTLAAALAAALANGLDVPEAVHDAQEYTWQALANGFRPGMGQLLPDRFFWARDVGGQENDEAPA
jgi:hydroxymethylpyrimidine/phosphomethylpyrimidine kinase